MTHQFGLFASINPLGNDSLGITVGYAGVWVRYLDEFMGAIPLPTGGFRPAIVRTSMPQVFKHGINLAARYRVGNFTIRTDHNYSFWDDKNYRIFNLHRPHANLVDWGLRSVYTIAADMAYVRHSFLWNGLGVSYRFTDTLYGSVSARNLLRIDETPQVRMLNNYFAVEVRATFNLGASVETFVGFVFDHTARSVSESLSAQSGEFPPGFTPRDTFDTRLVVQIPVGLTVRLQRDMQGGY